MPDKLLIVESLTKTKTINKYLGNDYKVLASFGHIRDLPKKKGSIDVNHQFQAKYQIIAKNKKHLDEIISEAKLAKKIYLATDPDREGEAIAWHIEEVLTDKKLLKDKELKRITFNEITQDAVLQAIKSPRDINENLVNAQQARLALDYLLGFNISPLLWKKVKPGLSAGRVQSPALRLICEREQEILSFVPEDYFSIHLDTHKKENKFTARLINYNDKKIEVKSLKTMRQTNEILEDLATYTSAEVVSVINKEKSKNPLPPFITSSLQIEAARKLGFNTDITMKIAQRLYEGIDLGGDGATGLITYMRTDSVNLSQLAMNEIRDYIKDNYDPAYLPSKAKIYINKAKNAQEAHEAIRPTSIYRSPASIKKYLSSEEYKLYELIWLRTIACQMNAAILDMLAIDIKIGDGLFRTNGITTKFAGYTLVYQESNDEKVEENDHKLPLLQVGDKLPIDKLYHQAHKTEPKPRYTEASLLKTLEDLGIGRPGTYVTIFSTLKKREYVIMDKKKFVPTDIGIIVNKFLTNHFYSYVDYDFTAQLENTLDDISNGVKEKLPILEEFWFKLQAAIKEKEDIPKAELTSELLEENCPECGKKLMLKLGKFGKFIGCSGYPQCRYMQKSIDSPMEVLKDRKCPLDEGELIIRSSKYGKFISCNNYPKCRYIENLENCELDIPCPECDNGKIVKRKNRFGKWFYACNNYPNCKTIFNYEPIEENCPNCNYKILLKKVNKNKGSQKVCPKGDYAISYEVEKVE